MTARTIAPALRAGAVAALLLLAAAPVRAQGVHVAILPQLQTVAPGDSFDVELDVTQAGHAFNGFDITVSYDPAALTFVPASPLSAQQGCLMTGGCSAACGNTFHDFHAAGDSLAITDILLCDQVSLTGPGQIYKLRFKASTTQQVTLIGIRRAVFYDAGLYVTPVVTTGDSVKIAHSNAVPAPAPVAGLRLAAGPNPARGPVALVVASDRAGDQVVEVHDLAGRLVRRLATGPTPAGVRRLAWDGTDARGARVPAGIYLITVTSATRRASARVVLVP